MEKCKDCKGDGGVIGITIINQETGWKHYIDMTKEIKSDIDNDLKAILTEVKQKNHGEDN